MSNLPKWLTELPLAHRGLHDAAKPENSLSAFQAAREAGYGIECDVQLTMDRVMAVVHDKDLKRMTGKKKTVASSTYQSLRKYPLLDTNERVPALHQLLQVAAGEMPLLIEIKPGRRPKERALRTLFTLQGYEGPVALQSFDPRIVTVLKRNTTLPVGQIMGRYREPSLPKAMRRQLEAKWREELKTAPDFIAFDLKKLTPEISDAISSERPLLTWTAKDERKLAQARVLADNVIFEHVRPVV